MEGTKATATLRFGHSPDPDDAYMFYGFAHGGVRVHASGGQSWNVEHVLEDIQSLNERALVAELEITAISAHAYPYIAEKYWVMRTGVSMGDGYGPIIVTRNGGSLESLRGARIAIPGTMTTAALALKFYLDAWKPVIVPFDQILEVVREGKVDAGVVIHEGQLTYGAEGLVKVADLGELWKRETQLPLPLGLDVVRKDLGEEVARASSQALRASIDFARANHEAAMTYALEYGRGLDMTLGNRFVGMYVNDWTYDLGEQGKRALETLLGRAAEAGWVPRVAGGVVLV